MVVAVNDKWKMLLTKFKLLKYRKRFKNILSLRMQVSKCFKLIFKCWLWIIFLSVNNYTGFNTLCFQCWCVRILYVSHFKILYITVRALTKVSCYCSTRRRWMLTKPMWSQFWLQSHSWFTSVFLSTWIRRKSSI